MGKIGASNIMLGDLRKKAEVEVTKMIFTKV
jgi:hypothetical protein